MPTEVAVAVNETIRETFRSLLARRIGAVIQDAATDMDGAIAEDGPLADLAGVWSMYVTGLDLEDYEPIHTAKDWDARIEALKEIVIPLIQGLPAPAATADHISAYINADPRLADLAVSLRVAPPTPPDPEVAHGGGALAFSWDDDEDEVAAAAPAPAAPAPKPAALPHGDTRPTPLLFQLLEPIGVLLTDVADVTGIQKPTLSNIRNGKRPWAGLSEKQAHALADELDARVEAATALSRRLRELDPAVVDGNRA
jgi:hypothetical protein